MKKLINVMVLLLALNFLAVAGGVGYLFSSGKLDKSRIAAIKEVIFPPPSTQPVDTKKAEVDPTTQPTLKLETLLAKNVGLPAGEQIELMQRTFDQQQALLDRRQRELQGLKAQADTAAATLAANRAQLLKDRQALKAREDEAKRLATDEGFQNSLSLYNTMTGKQIKQVFVNLDDDTVMKYLTAMEPRTAGKVIKEFKTEDEVRRIQQVLEKMRQAKAGNTQPSPAQVSAKEP